MNQVLLSDIAEEEKLRIANEMVNTFNLPLTATNIVTALNKVFEYVKTGTAAMDDVDSARFKRRTSVFDELLNNNVDLYIALVLAINDGLNLTLLWVMSSLDNVDIFNLVGASKHYVWSYSFYLFRKLICYHDFDYTAFDFNVDMKKGIKEARDFEYTYVRGQKPYLEYVAKDEIIVVNENLELIKCLLNHELNEGSHLHALTEMIRLNDLDIDFELLRIAFYNLKKHIDLVYCEDRYFTFTKTVFLMSTTLENNKPMFIALINMFNIAENARYAKTLVQSFKDKKMILQFHEQWYNGETNVKFYVEMIDGYDFDIDGIKMLAAFKKKLKRRQNSRRKTILKNKTI